MWETDNSGLLIGAHCHLRLLFLPSSVVSLTTCSPTFGKISPPAARYDWPRLRPADSRAGRPGMQFGGATELLAPESMVVWTFRRPPLTTGLTRGFSSSVTLPSSSRENAC